MSRGKIPTRKGYRPISVDWRDPAHPRVIQWESEDPSPPPDHIADAQQKVSRPSFVQIERQAGLFDD